MLKWPIFSIYGGGNIILYYMISIKFIPFLSFLQLELINAVLLRFYRF